MEAQPTEKRKIFDIIKSNIKVIIGIIFFLLVLLSFYSWSKFNKDIKKTNLSENYIEAKILLSQKKSNEALDVLEKIIDKEDSTYSVLSLYLIIDKKLEKDTKKVLNYFNKVLSIGSLKSEDLDLVKLKKAIFISNYANETEILDLLNPIINSDSVWKAQSIKFLGDFYFSKKEYDKADQYYSTLLNSENDSIDIKEIKRRVKTYKK
tara:strand:- start:561 stop:1181 length:621 start_codon:yes stop_codon:yes gene_type:complete